MEYYSISCEILKQISNILSKECNNTILLIPNGKSCWTENGFSVEFEDVDIPCSIISIPNPKYPNDQDGYYKVNRIRFGKTILNDTINGYSFSYDEIKLIITGEGKWAYINKN